MPPPLTAPTPPPPPPANVPPPPPPAAPIPVASEGVFGRVWRALRPQAFRARRLGGNVFRRTVLGGKSGRVPEGPNLLPLLIRVLAGFSRLDARVLEEEIDSSLGFLRHDYPEAVYSELRRQFRQALNEQTDMDAMAASLATQLSPDRKILLAIQLYDLITRAGQKPEHLVAFYSFVSKLGMAAQAIDIVLQLNAPEQVDGEAAPAPVQKGASPLESLVFGSFPEADVLFRDLNRGDRLVAYRYHDLILIKNLCKDQPVVANGRPVLPGTLSRLYQGQRLVVGERVLAFQELENYFNAKKNVAVPQVYLEIDDGDEVSFERGRTRDSVLEIRFALKVRVTALKTIMATLNGVPLIAGAKLEAALEDKIIFHNSGELPLIDVRRRARAMGSRYQLIANKNEYLVSNNSSLLSADDILLSPGASGEVLLKITCDYDARIGNLEVLQASRPILVGEMPVRNSTALKDGDVIRIDSGQVLRCNFSERVIEEERNVIRTLEVRDLTHQFGGVVNNVAGAGKALDALNFSLTRGEMVCVMGASGSGKSTLLKTLAGQQRPQRGTVLLNGRSLYDEHENLRRYISYIPQDDAFDEHLTIEENLTLAAALRSPHLSSRERSRRIDGKLIELGLNERRSSIVGNPTKKTLSGGERKRLNIGLDMVSLADVYLFDEPTSGLSSKDSEHVIEIIKGISHNKIVLVTIHQPSSKLFQMFSKVLLMDKGGRLVFFGTPNEALTYFAEAEHQSAHGVSMEGCKACGSTRPEFIFDVLETPLRDMSGDVIYEENSRGQLVPARRFSPEYWRDKYESHRLLQDMRQLSLAPGSRREGTSFGSSPGMSATWTTPGSALPPRPTLEPIRWRDEVIQLRTLFKRAFLSKMRNRANLLTTIVEAPVLATLIALVLRYNESGKYDFASAYHIPSYLFLMLVVAMFLGLTNSADDIVRDRVLLQRERNLKIRLPYYILA
ncbi:MAG: ATP-binding cassette domain-containing protein, partial [Verrucomicrobia bacterium]|nr:ATP-binding cassette domain-containing protein [Verrucomicrobiota bacterium]